MLLKQELYYKKPARKCILCLAWFSESSVSSGDVFWHDDAS